MKISSYPFLAALKEVREAVREVSGKPYAWYLQELDGHKERLLDLKEDVLDPVRRFMGGAQRAIYDEARTYLAETADNFVYGGNGRANAIRAVLDDPKCFKGNAIQQVKGMLEALKVEVDELTAAERKAALADVEELGEKLRALPEYGSLAETSRLSIEAEFAGVLETIETAKLIALMRERASTFKSSTYLSLLDRVTAPARKPSPAKPAGGGRRPGFEDGGGGVLAPRAQTETKYVAAASLRVAYTKPFLADEGDVETYLGRLRETLMAEIRSGKRITV